MTSPEVLEASWTAVPLSVPSARHAVLAHLRAADMPDPPLNDVGLAVSEAATNVVHHAYRDRDEPGPVHVRVQMRADELELIVEDEGSGMIPRADTPGLGLGLPLLAAISERFEVEARAGGGTRVSVWFKTV